MGEKSYLATLLLSLFLGCFGADRFYLGKVGTGIIKLLTFGGWGVWWIVDLLLTLFGVQQDESGRTLAGYRRHRKTVWTIAALVFGFNVTFGIVSSVLMVALELDAITATSWAALAGLAISLAAVGITLRARARARARP